MRAIKLSLVLLLGSTSFLAGTLDGGVDLVLTGSRDLRSPGDAQYYNILQQPAMARLVGRHNISLQATGNEMAFRAIDTNSGHYIGIVDLGGAPGQCYLARLSIEARELGIVGFTAQEWNAGPVCVPANPPPGGGPPPQSEYEGSPILIDLDRNGLHLVGPNDPVEFDLDADGLAESWTWTAGGHRDGILVIDRNGSGYVEDGGEMAGRFLPSGVLAEVAFDELEAWDKPENGGNDDGWISAEDSISSSLWLWVDQNHNGISESGELLTLAQARVTRIAYRYIATRRQDEHGNLFRYRSKAGLLDSRGRERLDPIYDVFFFKAY
jgi:hypothetical protein